MTEERLIDKVRKLLALAESNNEHEAALAAERAQDLMLKYGIELAQVAARKERKIGVDKEEVVGKVDPWRRVLAQAVAQSLGGSTVWWNEYRKWTGGIEFYGQAGTVPSMVALYEYLEGQLVVISALEAAKVGHANAAKSMQWRRSFLIGAATRIQVRLIKRRRDVERTADNSKALVLVRDAVKEAIDRDNPMGLSTSRINPRVDPEAYRAGTERANEVDLGDARIDQESTRQKALNS